MPQLIAVFVLVCLVAPLVYALSTRPIGDVVVYSAMASVGVWMLIQVLFLAYWLKITDRSSVTWQTYSSFAKATGLISTTVGPIYFGLLVIALDVVPQRLLQTYANSFANISPHLPLVITTVAVLAVGCLLFAIRYFVRCVYGLTETLVGVVVAVYRIRTDLPTLDRFDAAVALAVLTAGIYLIVRGLDNIHQGYFKEPRDLLVVAYEDRRRRNIMKGGNK